MSDFKELIKSFPKTREYVRDFFVYGFKTREEFREKSPRTYDNERRRIESWLSGFVKQDYTDKGKNISLAIDSNLLDTNPLYRVWKTKSFTDNDIRLHFFLLDIIPAKEGLTIDEITDRLLTDYGALFDVQTVRRKCNAYAKEGLLQKEKQGKDMLFRKAPDFHDTAEQFPMLITALQYYQLSSPLGFLGDTVLDTLSSPNNTFRVKHSFFVHTLEDEVLLKVLDGIRQKRILCLSIKGSKTSTAVSTTGIPLQIFTSTRTGRRFLCLYMEASKRFRCVRMDTVKEVELLDIAPDFDSLRKTLIKNHDYLWGVSFQGGGHTHLETITLTLHIQERTEDYILERLSREGKGGTITKIAPHTYTYEKEVFDSNEMLPWLRTFTGRILDIKCSNERLTQRFYKDLGQMYKLYDI